MTIKHRLNIRRFAVELKYNTPALVNRLMRRYRSKDIMSLKNCMYYTNYINEYKGSNAFYGMSSVLRQYASYTDTLPVTVEHGVYFGGGYFDDIYISGLPGVITFSEARAREINNQTGIESLAIGPYILYAQPFLSSEEKMELKQMLGSVLLVYPVHTIEKTSAEYNLDNFITEILSFKNEFNIKSVIVSLYFNDIKQATYFREAGFYVTCAGYRMDNTFLSRQRTMLELADLVVTNSVGTHIGYSVALDKPCSLLATEIKRSFDSERARKGASPNFGSSRQLEELHEVEREFSGIFDSISLRQKQIVAQYWGDLQRRSKDEINQYLQICKNKL